MKKYCILLLITGSICFITSCQQAPTVKAPNDKMSDTTAPAFDLAKAKEWIESDNKKFEEEMKKGDSNALAAHYGPDAWLMFDNSEPMKGKDITSGWGGAIRAGVKGIKVTTVDLTGNAELLVETGMYEMMGNDNKILDKGKYVVVWKPENGGWKIYRDIGNSNMPMKK
ncbi:MAG: YybH family protein [Niastella sp.]|jgi:ketosteroid isomerase-like protein|uniref:YybH family protein n=1 Tax=Niastella sp. TaxID=1869183 RepID=UPI003899A24C